MRLVFAGTPEVAVIALDALMASHHDVVAVLTRPPAPSGRGRTLTNSAVHHRALEAGLPVLTPERITDPEFVTALRELQPECVPVVAYGAMISGEALDLPQHGWVNLHFSLLPRWRGAAPVQAAILHGDALTGASTFRIDAGLDTGPVFETVQRELTGNETSGELLAELAHTGARLLVDTMDGIANGTLVATAQPRDGVTLAPKLTTADAKLHWSAEADVIDRTIRGCNPQPGAWTTVRGERLKVLRAEIADGHHAPSGVLSVTKSEVTVATATADLRLLTVQPQGKKPMSAADWARGLRLESGELCE